MSNKLSLVVGVVFMLFMTTNLVVAQEYPILWQDYFDDDDLLALKNVGWLYDAKNIQGQITEQRNGELFIQAGKYSIFGIGGVETNGVPEIFPGDTARTKAALLLDSYSHPNQILTFKFMLKKLTTSYAFIVSTRMVFTDITAALPFADPIQSPGYGLYADLQKKVILLGKYEGPFAGLLPDTWTKFGQNTFTFSQGVYYRIKYYLKEGDIKVKIWEGEPQDEPATWLIEGIDPAPRVSGTFTLFGLLGGIGDQFVLDDIVMYGFPTSVEPDRQAAPVTFELAQNYPNPFNPITTIAYSLSKDNPTRLVIYNTRGQVVRTLVDANVTAGFYTITWDGTDEANNPVAGGIYFYQLVSGNCVSVRKLALIK